MGVENGLPTSLANLLKAKVTSMTSGLKKIVLVRTLYTPSTLHTVSEFQTSWRETGIIIKLVEQMHTNETLKIH